MCGVGAPLLFPRDNKVTSGGVLSKYGSRGAVGAVKTIRAVPKTADDCVALVTDGAAEFIVYVVDVGLHSLQAVGALHHGGAAHAEIVVL